MSGSSGSLVGLHRVLEPAGVLPQAAAKLDARPEIWPTEVRISLERLNLDAASFRQLNEQAAGDGDMLRERVLKLIAAQGKMHNPVTGSGGMLIGTVDEVGAESPLGLVVGQRVATLVSLTLTPLQVTDGLASWSGHSEQVPAAGHAILFGRSIAAVLPSDLPVELALATLDVCGAPALVDRVVRQRIADGQQDVSVAVIGAAGKSGSLSLAAARAAGASRLVGIVPMQLEADDLGASGLADEIAIADARDPVALSTAVGTPVDVTVVCVDVKGCEGGAILATAQGGTIIFFSMATSFTAAALGAEGLAADVTMLVGNGFVPGHADMAISLMRTNAGVRRLFESRLAAHG